MLEKLAEIVRGEVQEAGLSVEVPCIACDKRPYGSDACSADNFCPNVATPEGSLSLARWAVLLVAKGLEKECKGYQGETAKDAFVRDTAIMLLIAEAKEDTNDAV